MVRTWQHQTTFAYGGPCLDKLLIKFMQHGKRYEYDVRLDRDWMSPFQHTSNIIQYTLGLRIDPCNDFGV